MATIRGVSRPPAVPWNEYGVVARAELVAAGFDDQAIRGLVGSAGLRRLRAGWFAAPHADPAVCRAVALGGALSCVSVLARAGVWIPESQTHVLHLRLNGYRRRATRHVSGVRYCAGRPGPTRRAVDDLGSAVLAAAGCVAGAELTAIFDSLLNKRLVAQHDLAALLAGQPRRVLDSFVAADGSAGSGTETVLRLHLRSRRLVFRPQVFIPEVGTVDFLVGRRLVVEADSRRHHGGDGIEADRRRDLELHRLGFLPFRVSYQQVFYQFDRVAAALDAVIRRGEHRRSPEIDV